MGDISDLIDTLLPGNGSVPMETPAKVEGQPAKKRRGRPRKYGDDKEAYEAHKARSRRKSAEKVAAARDIGELPAVADPVRKEATRRSLKQFALTYFPRIFNLQFSEDHDRVIATIEDCVFNGGRFACAMPRGSGKSSLALVALIWMIFWGHRLFPVIVCATSDAAKEAMLEAMQLIEDNELLLADFPEVVFAIREIKGSPGKATGQTYKGKRTRLRWTDKHVSFPIIEGSPASAAGLARVGLNGAVRGKKKAGPDNSILRPDFALIDDPSDDRSAKVHNQNNVREGLIESALAMLAGPGKNMAMVMMATIIEPGDVADRFLNGDDHPDWRGMVVSAMKSMPSDEAMKHWHKFRDLRKQSLKQFGTDELALQYYRENQLAMADGAVPYWNERVDPGMTDALCSIMSVWAKSEKTFYSEYQNQPQKTKVTNRSEPDSKMILKRSSSVPRGVIPDWATRVTASIDIQGTSLWWLVAAFSDSMRPHVVDHGIFPDQGKLYVTKSQLGRTLQEATNAPTDVAAWDAGLRILCQTFLDVRYQSQTGPERSIDLIAIDANWEQSTGTVYQIARQLGGGKILPIHGRARTAKQSSIDTFKVEATAKRGPGWISEQGVRQQLHLVVDPNHLKTWLYSQITSSEGGLSLFNGNVAELTLLADHLSSEFGVPMVDASTNRTVVEWQLRPGRDNEYLDCSVYASVAASYCGSLLPGQEPPVMQPPPKYVKVSELLAQRQQQQRFRR